MKISKHKVKTVSLREDQYLIQQSISGIAEMFCIGYTSDGKRDRSIDGYYFNSEIHLYVDKPRKNTSK